MREKCSWQVKSDMFGHTVRMLDGDTVMVTGDDLTYDPMARMSTKLKNGYLFRNPQASADDIAAIWGTAEDFEHPFNAWVEVERQTDRDPVYTAFVRCKDASDATAFAFRHNDFEKWSDDKEKADKKARKQAARDSNKTLKVRKDGTVRVNVTVSTLSD